MFEFLLRRLGQALLVAIGVFILAFVLIRLMPGDPAQLMNPQASEEALPAIRHQLGLDKPLPYQLVDWVAKAARGDFGTSVYLGAPVRTLLAQRFPRTVLLVLAATFLAILIAFPLGIVAAVVRDSAVDRVVLALAVIVRSLPVFWVGIMLLMIVSVRLGLLPAIAVGGQSGPEYLVLPSIALSLSLVPILVRTTRATMVSALESAYVVAARARGIPGSTVVLSHAFKNCLLPLVTTLGVQMGFLLSGAAVTEVIFNYQGLGMLMIQSVMRRDYPIIQAGAFVIALTFVIINALVDLSYGFIDPRIRKAAAG